MSNFTCSSLDVLVSVVLTAKVTSSTLEHIGARVGDTLSLTFNVDPSWVTRDIKGQGIVQDGIGPFGLCAESFLLSSSSGYAANLVPPAPVDAASPVGKDAVSSSSLGLPPAVSPFWFSLMRARPVLDGFFVSSWADKAAAGVPLDVHGGSSSVTTTAFIDVKFERHTFDSVKLLDSFGSYDKTSLRPVESSIRLARDWESNTVLEAEFVSLTIGSDTATVSQRAIHAQQKLADALKTPSAPNFAPAPHRALEAQAAGFPETCCWCDEATPEEVQTITGPTDGAAYHLVFSDEFNTPGRTFANGDDAKWTALEVGDTANQGVAFYLPDQATVEIDSEATGEGKGASALLITTADRPHTGDSPTGEHGVKMPYQSAMLQSWNKFCFTSGIVEYKARQPRGAGYWPALWLFGNLGRAVYQNSNTGLWPWSYDQCDTDLELPPTDPPQRISACDDHDLESEGLHAFQGRGATELDVLEGAVTDDGVMSYSVGSLQLSPGVPSHYKPPLSTFPTADGAGKWYTGLSFGTGGTPQTDGMANNGWYGPPWGSSCPTGCPDALSGGLVGLDDLDTRYWKYGMEWQTGKGGYLKWYYDDVFVWGMDASSFGAYSVCESRAGTASCHRTPERMIPNEPMSLVMNTAIGSWNGGKNALDNKHWPARLYVDHVRVWQKEANIGCDPPDFPTRVHIDKNAWMYGEPARPSGYDTCPEVYPPSAYANANVIMARGAAKRLNKLPVTTTGLAASTTTLFAAGGAAAAANSSDSAVTALLGLVGFAAALAGGYTWGVRAGRAGAHAGVVPRADELESNYAKYDEANGRS